MSKKQDPSKNYAAFLYSISHDPDFLQIYFDVPPEAVEQTRISHERLVNNAAGSIKGLISLIEKYPGVPQFKNLLGAAYDLSGNYKKSTEVNDEIIREHPDYLFGKLNKAHQYLYEKKPEKVIELLGKWLDIKALYPKRDLFHISEVMAFYKVACLYYLAVKNFEAANRIWSPWKILTAVTRMQCLYGRSLLGI
jgi:tetratricopeptide (TPR) repeat protein